ncbi:MAG: tandem-95 repeat protein, partial [Candidatus Marinimicrobia bacterium]|nr:tandem-95 repeat protein [Candidatus Neomarinimicrobiota bacterium]
TVTAGADVPNLAVSPASGDEDTAISLDITSSLIDVDGSESLLIDVTGVPVGASLSAGTDLGEGHYELTPGQLTDLTITPPNNNDDDFDLTVTATSTESENGDFNTTAPLTLSVTVYAVVDVPTLTTADDVTDEDIPLEVTFSSALTDTDGSENLELVITGLPEGGTITAITSIGDGTHIFTVTPPLNQHDDFTLTVTSTSTEDENDDSADISSNIFIEVLPVNDDPILGDLSDLTTDEDVSVTVDISGFDVDIETDGQVLTFSCSSGDDVLVLCSVNEIRGETSAQLNLDVQENRHGSSEITVTVNDNFGRAIDTGSFTLLVNAVADSSDISVLNVAGNEDEAIQLHITPILTDTDGSETAFVVANGFPVNGELSQGTLQEDGSYLFDDTELSQLYFTPPENGSENFLIYTQVYSTESSNDSIAEGELQAFHINVIAVADPPILSTENGSTLEDVTVELMFSSVVQDLDGSESLSVNISNIEPENAIVTDINALGDGLFSFSVTPFINDDSDIIITVISESSESENNSVHQVSSDILVSVAAVPDLPDLLVEDVNFDEDVPTDIFFQSGLTDDDGSEILQLDLSGYPDGTIISDFPDVSRIDNYTFQIQTPENYNGEFILNLTAISTEQSNGQFISHTETMNVIVASVDDPPLISEIPDQTVEGCSSFQSFNWSEFVYEVDEDEVEFSYTGNTQLVVTVNGSGDVNVLVPQPYWTGSETITFIITDLTDEGLSSSMNVIYTINPLQVFYYDLDGDGLGAGDGLEFCPNQIPESWVPNNDDLQPDCYTNDEDICGYCGGENAVDEFGFVTGPNADCFGFCDGAAEEDECGVCGGDNSSCNQPIAYDLTVNTNESISVQFTLIAEDPNDDELATMIVTGVSEGQLDATADPMVWDYTPDTGYFGTDGFTYRVSDDEWESNLATVTINVLEVNDPPIGSSYVVNLLEDNSIGFDLSGIDDDTSDEMLTFTIIQMPDHGSISEGRAVESYTFTPVENYFGPDELIYEVGDGEGISEPAVITFNVTAVNDQPVIQGAIFSGGSNEIAENASVQITIDVNDVEENDTEILLISGPNHGELSDFEGSITMTYEPEDGYTGTDQFIIRAREISTPQQLMSSQFTVNLTIVNVNDAPVAFHVTTTVSEDEVDVEIGLSADDPDDDDLIFTIFTDPLHGNASTNGDLLIYTPDLNYFGPDTVEYQAFDGEYYSTPAMVSITVIPVNDLPTVEDLEFFDVTEGFVFEIMPIDVDGDEMSIEFIPDADEGWGQSFYGGLVEPLPDGSFVYHLGFISTMTDFIFYVANDNEESSEIGLITFNIPEGTFSVSRNVPIAVNQLVNLNEDVPAQLSLIGADIENIMDENATVQITQYPIHGMVSELVVDTISSDYVTWLTLYTPELNFYGDDSLKYTVNNPNNLDGALSGEGTIIIHVSAVNDVPVFTTIPAQFVDEDTQMTLPLDYSDPDNELLLSYTSSNPAKLNISNSENQLTLQPVADYNGVLSVIVTVTEASGDGLQVARTFSLTVNSVNDLPLMNPISNVELLEEQSTTITMSANDIDGVENFEYSGSVTSNPELLQISFAGDILTITPVQDMTGESEISVWVDDGRDVGELSDPAVFTVNVTNVNDAPVITSLVVPDPVNEDGGPIEFTMIPVDVDEGDMLTATISVTNSQLFPPGSATITPMTAGSQVQRTVSLQPALNKSGEATVLLTISDGNASISSQIQVTVLPVNDTPVIAPISDLSILEDAIGSLTINATDVEGSSLIYSLIGGVHISSLIDGDVISFTPEIDWTGTEYFTLAASDGQTFSTASFNVIITPVNDTPVITSTANTIAYVFMPYSYQLQVQDVDQGIDPFNFQLNTYPTGMSISSTGLISWTPPLGVFNSGTVNVIVTDDGSLTASQSFIITVIQIDCADEYNGSAVIDDCGECVEGTTGLAFNYSMDCEGVCFGTDFIALDCAGVCYGSSALDLCGICDDDPLNDNSTCTGCTDLSAINYEDGNIVDDGSCVFMGDLNADQLVNVGDVIDMVNIIIFGLIPDEYQLLVGDLSGDAYIDIHDIVLLIAAILGDDGLGLKQSLQEGNLQLLPGNIRLLGTGSVAALDIQTMGEYQISTVQDHTAGIFRTDNRLLIIAVDGVDLQNLNILHYTGELSVVSATLYDWDNHTIQANIIEVPEEFEITEIYPNPFNAETNIRFTLPEDTKITVSIYDLNGRLIDTFWDGETSVGSHSVHWDAKMEPSGIYFIKISTPDKLVTRKITLMK